MVYIRGMRLMARARLEIVAVMLMLQAAEAMDTEGGDLGAKRPRWEGTLTMGSGDGWGLEGGGGEPAEKASAQNGWGVDRLRKEAERMAGLIKTMEADLAAWPQKEAEWNRQLAEAKKATAAVEPKSPDGGGGPEGGAEEGRGGGGGDRELGNPVCGAAGAVRPV